MKMTDRNVGYDGQSLGLAKFLTVTLDIILRDFLVQYFALVGSRVPGARIAEMPKLRPKIERTRPTKEVSVMSWIEDAEPRVLLVRQALRESWRSVASESAPDSTARKLPPVVPCRDRLRSEAPHGECSFNSTCLLGRFQGNPWAGMLTLRRV
jgi:hypothetical protein